MGISEQKQVTIFAYERGYRVDAIGNVYSPSGVKRVMSESKPGYLSFSIKWLGKSKVCYAHHLQAYQLHKDRVLKKGVQVRHLNGISTDNSAANIGIGSHSDNMMDIDPVIRKIKATKASRAANPRTTWERTCIYLALWQGISYRTINRTMGVAKGTISFMKNSSEEYLAFAAAMDKLIDGEGDINL